MVMPLLGSTLTWGGAVDALEDRLPFRGTSSSRRSGTIGTP